MTTTTDLLHPSLGLSAGYRFSNTNDNVTLNVDSVYNPRPASDLSGTLSLELWALSAPYDGGDFKGHPLAGACIGSLSGQQNWASLSYDLPLSAPPSGTWYITLMLREWTGPGYTTRSHHNFPLAVTFPHFDVSKSPAPVAPLPAPPSPTPAAKLSAPKSQPTPPAPPPAPAAKPAPVDTRLSINKATAKELTSIDGISPALAKSIIAARPFAKFDDLLKIKGVTAKLFGKLQPNLRLE